MSESLSGVLDAITSTKALVGCAIAAGGFAAGHLWDRYKNRMVVLRWSVVQLHQAVSSKNSPLGNIEVQWNGAAVPNLHLIRLEIQNESGTKDLDGLPIKVALTDDSNFIGGWDFLGVDSMEPSAAFGAALQRAVDAHTKGEPGSPADAHMVFRRREFTVSVLNRGDTATYKFLVVNDHGNPPIFELSCAKPGVRVRFRAHPLQQIFGVPTWQAQLFGQTLGLALTALVAVTVDARWAIAALAFVIGDFCGLLGAGAVRAGWWIKKAIG